MRRDETIPRETFKVSDRVRAYIYDVRKEARGPQIFLSRTHPQFVAKLFAQEVPEIYDGIIEIKSVARDPGSRAKIGVVSNDSSIDPVGACVGMRGSRVQAVVQEIQGEKIDIIPWSPDPATFVVNALAPAEVAKVVLDEDDHRIEVVVPDDQLSLAIGRRGQNVRLASMLTGWALVTEGFTKVDEVAAVAVEDLGAIEGFDEAIAEELQSRAQDWIARRDAAYDAKRREMGVADDIAAFEVLSPAMLVALGEKGVLTLDDLADLAGDELVEILGKDEMSEETANAIIMKAREHWFAGEEQT
jgi:N utilization substance protein A